MYNKKTTTTNNKNKFELLMTADLFTMKVNLDYPNEHSKSCFYIVDIKTLCNVSMVFGIIVTGDRLKKITC
jgi:hypothetical protein